MDGILKFFGWTFLFFAVMFLGMGIQSDFGKQEFGEENYECILKYRY